MSEEVKIDAKRVQAITNTGQAYDDVDPLVEAARNHAIKECRRYNFLVNSQNKYDYSILKGLFNKMGGGKLHRTQLHVRIRPEHFAGEQCLHQPRHGDFRLQRSHDRRPRLQLKRFTTQIHSHCRFKSPKQLEDEYQTQIQNLVVA